MILLVDDHAETLQTLARAVRQRYTPRFTVMTADDAAARYLAKQMRAAGLALAILHQLQTRGRQGAPWRCSWLVCGGIMCCSAGT